MARPRIPRIFFVVPGLLAGLLVPALTSSPKPLPPGAEGMTNSDFANDSITLHVGQRLTLFNNSRVVHVIGPGTNNHVFPERGVPLTGFHLLETNSFLVTGRWETPGSFDLTCTVHPGMNLTVVVVRN
jgi:plastocyanin